MTGFRHIASFLEGDEFKGDLVNACINLEILSEADLQVFVCRKLYELFASAPALKSKYRVNAEPFCRELKCYPDIVIFHRHAKALHEPFFAIELKEGHSFGTAIQHDCRKLRQYRGVIGVRRAYLIHVVHVGPQRSFWSTFAIHKHGLKNVIGIPVVMKEVLGSRYQSWHADRRDLLAALRIKPAMTSELRRAAAAGQAR